MPRTRNVHSAIRFRNEHSIASSCEVRGRGYWTGQEVCVVIHPAPAGTGVQLVRTDLEPTAGNDASCGTDVPNASGMSQPRCKAVVDYRQDAAMRTNMVCGDAKFQMVEHLMAALVAMEIDNCIVEIDGEEFPSLDGSSLAFAEALSHAGLIIQAKSRRTLVIDQRYRVGSPDGWIEAAPPRRNESFYKYQLQYDSGTPIADQSYSLDLTPDRFMRDVAPARTFVTAQQAATIRASGVAGHVSNCDLLVIGPDGPIDNEYRFDNECARHKTLDLIGDLALAGVDLVGRFTSFRGGHILNGAMASLLFDLAASQLVYEQNASRNPGHVAIGMPAVNSQDVNAPQDAAPNANNNEPRIRRYVRDPVTQGFRRCA